MAESDAALLARRYGLTPGGRPIAPVQPPPTQPAPVAAAPAAPRTLPTVLDEKLLKVTMVVVVVKILPSK